MKNKLKIQIGAHVSVSGGVHKAVKRAADLGCNAMQIFSGSPRTWQRKDLDKINVEKLFSEQKKYKVTSIFTHALYLVNLVSEKKENYKKSVDSILYDLRFDARIKGKGVIVHLGSHKGRGWDAVKDQLVKTLQHILSSTPKDSTLLIENSAGQKGKLSSDLFEIRWLFDQLSEFVQQGRLGWCVDTAHSFANGYLLVNPKNTNNKTQTKVLQNEISRLNLWSTLGCIHVNDSKDSFDSGRDRHANIGMGEIPFDHLISFLRDSRVRNIPMILEVPSLKGKGDRDPKEDVEEVKRIVGSVPVLRPECIPVLRLESPVGRGDE